MFGGLIPPPPPLPIAVPIPVKTPEIIDPILNPAPPPIPASAAGPYWCAKAVAIATERPVATNPWITLPTILSHLTSPKIAYKLLLSSTFKVSPAQYLTFLGSSPQPWKALSSISGTLGISIT